MKFRTAYDKKRNGKSDVDFSKDAGLTRQAHKDECDINVIMGKYLQTGLIAHVNQFEGRYGDFAAIDFAEAMATVTEAQEMFMTIPSDIREQFGNDPGNFLEFATNPENQGKLEELGLLPSESKHPTVLAKDTVAPPPPPPEPPKAENVPDPT